MKKTIILMLCIVGLNVTAVDAPSNNDINKVLDIFGTIFNKVTKPKLKEAPKSKPVDVRKVYISREQLEALMKDAREKGKKDGYKEGYRDGYKDGYIKKEKK